MAAKLHEAEVALVAAFATPLIAEEVDADFYRGASFPAVNLEDPQLAALRERNPARADAIIFLRGTVGSLAEQCFAAIEDGWEGQVELPSDVILPDGLHAYALVGGQRAVTDRYPVDQARAPRFVIFVGYEPGGDEPDRGLVVGVQPGYTSLGRPVAGRLAVESYCYPMGEYHVASLSGEFPLGGISISSQDYSLMYALGDA
jgi:hypothetical protein